MTPKKLFDLLGGIDPAYVAEADITGSAPAGKPAKKKKDPDEESGFKRFMSSPVAAAVLSGVVAFGVLFLIIRAGRAGGKQPVGTAEATGQNTQSELQRDTQDADETVTFVFPPVPETDPDDEPYTEKDTSTEYVEPVTRPEPIMPPEVDLLDVDPTYASAALGKVRILVQAAECAPSISSGSRVVLSEGLVARDTALRDIWGCEPDYFLHADAQSELNHYVLAGVNEYALCMYTLENAFAQSIHGYELDLTGLRLGLGTGIWDQGITALTLNGQNLYTTPANDVLTNDRTYAVFYDTGADGGALLDEINQLGSGWTYDKMMELVTRSEGLDPDGDGKLTQGMGWGDRTYSALLLGSGLRVSDIWYQGTYTNWLVDKADLFDCLNPVSEYFKSGKAELLKSTTSFPISAGTHVFNIGPLSWRHDGETGTLNSRLTVLPIPKQSADQDSFRTSAFGGACLFIPVTAYDKAATFNAPALYMLANVTNKTVKTAYLDEMAPASDATSRRNVEILLKSRTYDVVLHGAVTGWTVDQNPVPNSLKKISKTIDRQIDVFVKQYMKQHS